MSLSKIGKLIPFSSVVLTVLENGKLREAIEYKLTKGIIQNCFCGTHTLYCPATDTLYLQYINTFNL